MEDALHAEIVTTGTELLLGVITDGLGVKQSEKVVRLGVLKYVDPRAVFISDQVGIGKPNPKLFQRALRRTGVRPGRAMLVGDNPVKDIAPAKAIGMIAVRSRRRGRHHKEADVVAPDYSIRNFDDLARLLRDEFGVPVSARGGRRS